MKKNPADKKPDHGIPPAPKAKKEEYPYNIEYPTAQDILNKNKRVEVDVENIAPGNILSEFDVHNPSADFNSIEEDPDLVPGTDADVTDEDLMILGDRDRDQDNGIDEELERIAPELGKTGEDLDVPGSEYDDADEEIGNEDEENNYYSRSDNL